MRCLEINLVHLHTVLLGRSANAEFNATPVVLFASGIYSTLSQQYSTQTQHVESFAAKHLEAKRWPASTGRHVVSGAKVGVMSGCKQFSAPASKH